MLRNVVVLQRGLYTHAVRYAASPLASLRKRTGYSIKKCKEAVQLYPDSIEKAEEWLHEIGQKEGWAKAAQVKDRTALQGLIGVGLGKNAGAIVEINCETDFVAKNENFRELTTKVTEQCVKLAEKQNVENNDVIKIHIDTEKLQSLKINDEKTLGDVVALTINQLRENLIMRRATLFRSGVAVSLHGNTHPTQSESSGSVSLGKYGALIALKSESKDVKDPEISLQLCNHIIGMAPKNLGNMDEIEIEHKDVEPPPAELTAEEEEEEIEKPKKVIKDDETRLLQQVFLMDEDVKVGKFVKENDLEVLDFYRYECGEAVET